MKFLAPTNGIERRENQRYPVNLKVRYRTLGEPPEITGFGRTIDVSSGGMLVACPHGVQAGVKLQVTLEWPIALEGTIPLQLVVHGKVVRHEESRFALVFSRYQFRTKGYRAVPLR